MNPSTLCARTLVQSLLSAGVRDVVLSPGSRSAPLVYAFADARDALTSSARPLRLHVRIDERDAAFTALGLAKAGRLRGHHRPVAVVTTSGSAVGNLHPAVMEAAHQHLPLVLVTADRPARLRGTGANQTLDAQHAALPEVVAAWDLPVPAGTPDGQDGTADVAAVARDWATAAEAAVTRACTSPLGPVQLNAQFDAPLVPDADAGAFDPGAFDPGAIAPGAFDPGAAEADDTRTDSRARVWGRIRAVLDDPDARPVIVAGDDLGFSTQTLCALVKETATPVFAEPSSALASSPRTIPAHAQVLGAEAVADLRAQITHVVVTGRPTLSRPIARLLDRPDVQRIDVPYDADGLIDHLTGPMAAPGVRDDERAGRHFDSSARPGVRAGWWDEWDEVGRRVEAPSAPTIQSSPVSSAADVTGVDAAVLALLDEPGVLVAASSNTVRLLARLQRPHHPARVVASRGLAGIDGLVATASGVALGLVEDSVPVRLLIGDLAALHDLGGLVVPAHEERPHLQIVVLNDDGGAIFAGLEHSQAHVAARFDRFFATPHGLDLAQTARALGVEAQSVDADDPAMRAAVTEFLADARPGLLQLRMPPVRG
ncbi:2-succinyl-5-enolpyruvyl-6-hydroxy-3-cyclohexene-1-carboxylic-acid synthase [Brevibacterium senegalense]|uniref:2-succinyl-5-enolpyruvyl-6-hydroxy-3- cyclohexene-1-carboxylic-acid synthase n=1 Tax=Brevibacterium senegalense TaxID=1033736 RepID=UPI0002F15B96|nr:2-succinyl-5-enolpyruvyl-6-hydroxy-3-cyclohexene-1-carboxylic-acid synthase [Brevibacterium senegalense]